MSRTDQRNHWIWICCEILCNNFKNLHFFPVTVGEEISGSEGSGSEEMDEGDDEGAEAGEGHRRRRGKYM